MISPHLPLPGTVPCKVRMVRCSTPVVKNGR